MPPKASIANSGIRKLSTGESIIPASTRPDGSMRKEIRVKPGYKPPEDVEVYKNKTAESWKNRGKGGVPGAEFVQNATSTTAANKNAKRREARKKAAAATASEGTSETNGGDEGAANGARTSEPNGTVSNATDDVVDPEAEKAKEARKLAKKLRQARELSEKKACGGSLLPEQLEKATKINELVRQLDSLGFDAKGEKKSNGEG